MLRSALRLAALLALPAMLRCAPSGGWSSYVERELERGAEVCTIPRVNATAMSAAELRARFASGSAEPAVIVGGFPAADDPVWQRNWSKSSRAVYKDLLELILQGGQELGPAEGAARMPAPPAWLRQAVPGGVHIIEHGQITEPSSRCFCEGPSVCICTGGHSGVAYHAHGAAINVMAFGAKRWFLQPPGWSAGPTWRRLADPWLSTVEYLANVHPHLPPEEAPIECMQRPGEVVFVPAGWQHATVNSQETISWRVSPCWLECHEASRACC